MDVLLREFGRYVRDKRRTALFAQAIAATVRPGDVVVDLGAGFGLLSMLSVRHGAARVYAIEQGPYVELGRAITRDNGMAERIIWVAGNSARVDLSERADVIVSETLGQWALEEYIVEYLCDAAHRLAKPHARMIPQSLALAVAPVSAPQRRAAWAEAYGPHWADVQGFDLTRLRQVVFVNEVAPYVPLPASEVELLAAPVEVARFALGTCASSRFKRDVAATCTGTGLCDGWLGMFSVTLAPRVVLSTWPGEPVTHWSNLMFALSPARAVVRDEVISARFGFLGAAGWIYELL